MRFMLLMYRDETVWDVKPEAERLAIRQQAIDRAEALRRRGIFLGGDPLLPTGTAVTVRMTGGKPMATDGPFAETKEQLGGYYIVEAANLDEALSIASRVPAVRAGGAVEVRPIMEMGPPPRK